MFFFSRELVALDPLLKVLGDVVHGIMRQEGVRSRRRDRWRVGCWRHRCRTAAYKDFM